MQDQCNMFYSQKKLINNSNFYLISFQTFFFVLQTIRNMLQALQTKRDEGRPYLPLTKVNYLTLQKLSNWNSFRELGDRFIYLLLFKFFSYLFIYLFIFLSFTKKLLKQFCYSEAICNRLYRRDPLSNISTIEGKHQLL